MKTKGMMIQQLAEHLGYADSEYLSKLLDHLLTEEEATLMTNLPDTPKNLTLKLDLDEKYVNCRLRDLFMRGLVLIDSHVAGEPIYLVDNNAGRFMDMILFDPRYQEEDEDFYSLWRDFFNNELVYAPRSPEKLPFRIIPVDENIEDHRTILPYEQVSEIIKNAKRIAVQNCPCRTREQRCSAPLETCISLNETAEYMITRNIGREIIYSEALHILKSAEEFGLVHETDNTDNPTIICNCCSCCCVFLRAITVFQQEDVIARSRFFAQFDKEKCILCFRCLARCLFKSITFVEGQILIDSSKCYGCGLCSTTCKGGAISMVLKENALSIPHKGDEFMQGFTNIP